MINDQPNNRGGDLCVSCLSIVLTEIFPISIRECREGGECECLETGLTR